MMEIKFLKELFKNNARDASNEAENIILFLLVKTTFIKIQIPVIQ
jgi:hypothetical protein